MRKLFLASFKFKTGETVYEQQRLVVVESSEVVSYLPLATHSKQKVREAEYEIAHIKAKQWFPTEFPESELILYQVYPAIDQPADIGFSILTWTPSFQGDDVKPEEIQKEGHSDDVLIDMDGWRKNFRVGWYDHEDDQWKFHNPEDEKIFDRAHMKWTHLPINKE